MPDDGEQIEAADTLLYCASCGIAENDDVKLMPCDDCDLVRYCGNACKELHRPEHEETCKTRATELREELLFKQPEGTHLGDCPICSLPLPLDYAKSVMYTCCSKVICHGCSYANKIREYEMRLQPSCPFCRDVLPKTNEEHERRRMKRIEANDPAAICKWGVDQYEKGEYQSAFEYFTKAAALGDAWAHYRLSEMYYHGKGVEKDEGKMIYHLEEAAIGGHPEARNNLGWNENENGNNERAVKHLLIAAKLGYDLAIKQLMGKYREGHVSKDDLDVALRAHKAAVDAMKSPQRKKAEEYYQILKGERVLR